MEDNDFQSHDSSSGICAGRPGSGKRGKTPWRRRPDAEQNGLICPKMVNPPFGIVGFLLQPKRSPILSLAQTANLGMVLKRHQDDICIPGFDRKTVSPPRGGGLNFTNSDGKREASLCTATAKANDGIILYEVMLHKHVFIDG